jgi:Gram-negative bacterial TonB protein C-terminal
MNRLLILFLFIFYTANVFAQESDWETLRTDDGEFSMKMPAGCYSHFYEPSGITLHQTGNIYHLKEMRLVSCFRESTLLDVEIYKSDHPRQAVEVLQSYIKVDGNKLSPGKGFYGLEKTVKKDNFVYVQRFIAGKNHVYIISAATRGEPNAMMQAFFESLKFASENNSPTTDSTEKFVSISALKYYTPELIYDTVQPNNLKLTNVPAKDDTTIKKAIVLSLPRPSFTESARKNKVGGNVSLLLKLGADGRINQFRVMKTLPEGLLREAVIAAMRIKYLPEEQNGKPRSSIQLIEYNFKTY